MSPLSEKSVSAPVVVPTCAKLVQPAPSQRSTRYPVTRTLSVAASQSRSIAVAETAVAVRFAGALGGSVSGGVCVVALARFEYGPTLGTASSARTR